MPLLLVKYQKQITKKVVGELQGLQIARDLIKESSKYIEDDDDE